MADKFTGIPEIDDPKMWLKRFEQKYPNAEISIDCNQCHKNIKMKDAQVDYLAFKIFCKECYSKGQ